MGNIDPYVELHNVYRRIFATETKTIAEKSTLSYARPMVIDRVYIEQQSTSRTHNITH